MLSLFEAFSLKCLQLQQAIRAGHDDLVRVLDRELDPLVTLILSYKAVTAVEVYMQLQFVSSLIREDADDRSCVLRHSFALSVLLDRYFSNELDGKGTPLEKAATEAVAPPKPDGQDDYLLNEAILEGLPDRVAVVTTDYRHIYSNPENASYLNKKPIELVGKHLSEVVGEQCFERDLRSRLDCCFAGEKIDFVYQQAAEVPGGTVRCRMTPLRHSRDRIAGAIVVFQDLGELRSLPAA